MLAVFTADLGQNFVNRHINGLMPGQTVAVARRMATSGCLSDLWTGACPVFLVDRWALQVPVRLARRAGLSDSWLRDRAIAQFLRKHKVQVVLGEFLHEFLDFVPLLDRMGLPYVVQGHGIDVSAALRAPGMAERYLAYKSARAILTRSEFHRQRLISLGLPAEKIHVNFGGVDVPPQVPQRDAGAAKRFLTISGFVAKKGPIYLLEAFRRAAARDREITLDVGGAGPLFPAVQQFVDAAGLNERVRLHGSVGEESKQRLLLECGVYIQHSITDPNTGNEEGLPAAIQEAMANGLAVVSTRHAGIPEAVIEGETGLLVDEGDVEGMADAMLRASQWASAFGRAGHEEAFAKHSWEMEKNRLLSWLSPMDSERNAADQKIRTSRADALSAGAGDQP
jgi:glycosyltransferase involved in cell wall biosynthesis